MPKTLKRLFSLVAATALTASITGFATPSDQSAPPGVQELINFQHVYKFTPPAPASTGKKGTDIEFYTSTVPKRDYTTGQLLGTDGLPLLPGLPPVMEARDFAIMGSYGGGGWIFDITNPEAPRFVKNLPCPGGEQNDVQIKKFNDTWVAVLAQDTTQTCHTPRFGSGTGGISLFDVTDPYAFRKMFSFRTTGDAHNFTFHPTKPFGAVSTGDLPGAAASVANAGRNHIPILNFTNVLTTPPSSTTVTIAADIVVEGGGPHDISYSADGNRMYVANENTGLIYDTTDPAAPVLLGRTPNVGTYLHGFDPTPNDKIAIATNESLALGGFFVEGTTVCPGEGITFYNVEGSNAQAPVPVGHFLANIQGKGPDDRACTAHVGKIAANNKVYVTGWYIGGVRVVDFTNPAMPREVGVAQMADANVWSAKFYKGPYVYVGDEVRGFDVFKWNGGDTAPWLTI